MDVGVLAPSAKGRQATCLLRSEARPRLLEVLAADLRHSPRYEKLVGDLAGCYSRRINIQHRLVYEVVPDEGAVHILRMWSRYEQTVPG